MKIAIGVHGRFHAFNLAQALTERGHDVTLFTNYPISVVRRFVSGAVRIRSYVLHALVFRALVRWPRLYRRFEPALMSMFGRWLMRRLSRERWDAVHCWSGICAESYAPHSGVSGLRLIMRGSAHIETQLQLLTEEEQRTGTTIEKPTPWMVQRELTEYELADRLVVLSEFAKNSFVAKSFPPERLSVLRLAASASRFLSSDADCRRREERIQSGERLHVLFVGNISMQKGAFDLATILGSPELSMIDFRLVGSLADDAPRSLRHLPRNVSLTGRVPESDLPEHYRWADLFLFPTIQDGFAVVLAQAAASGLPLVASDHSGAPDLIASQAADGWIIPARHTREFCNQLRWCHENRPALAATIASSTMRRKARDWNDVAEEFERICIGSETSQ